MEDLTNESTQAVPKGVASHGTLAKAVASQCSTLAKAVASHGQVVDSQSDLNSIFTWIFPAPVDLPAGRRGTSDNLESEHELQGSSMNFNLKICMGALCMGGGGGGSEGNTSPHFPRLPYSYTMASQQHEFSNWVGTIMPGAVNQDYKDGDFDVMEVLQGWQPRHPTVKYCVWQIEQAGPSSTPHLQVYLELNKPRDRGWIQRMLNCRGSHWEVRQGSADQAEEYCSKEETRVLGPFKYGTKKAQGKRTEMHHIVDLCKEGKSMIEIIDEVPGSGLRYMTSIEKYRQMIAPDRMEPPKVTWIFGPTRSGKTRFVYDKHGYDKVYKKDNTKWWNGYDQRKHQVILIDEFDWKSWKREDMLTLLDRYPMQGEWKGGYLKINSPFIYLTCNGDPRLNIDEYWLCPAMRARIEFIAVEDLPKLDADTDVVIDLTQDD